MGIDVCEWFMFSLREELKQRCDDYSQVVFESVDQSLKMLREQNPSLDDTILTNRPCSSSPPSSNSNIYFIFRRFYRCILYFCWKSRINNIHLCTSFTDFVGDLQ